ncbi:unnamed protein product [Moneuplotes crassus]|uniref:TRP C-terminal domain-containing protein n=1 Tax=Euplotes crassus TaxID=5936 RepID=A0AAD1Y962_EUPCR|nr:unnamed protein product [Moneuplotes crassus]
MRRWSKNKKDAEDCDDGDTLSGDGCDYNCKVEDGYTCSGGSLTSPDVCTKKCSDENCITCNTNDITKCYVCQDGYKLQSNLTCLGSNVTQQVKQMGQATMAATGAASSVAIGISLLSFSSPMAIWFLANQFQLFSLFLLTNTALPVNVVEYIKGNSMFSFSMDFIPFTNAASNGVSKGFNKDQKHQELRDIGLESQSAFVNNLGCLITLFIFVFCHLVVYLLQSKSARMNSPLEVTKFSKFMIKLYKIFTLGVYIRFVLEAFQLIVMSSFSEIITLDVSEPLSVVSWALALLLFCLSVAYFGIAVVHTCKLQDDTERSESSKLEEFNSGLKNKKLAKMYTPMILLRRYLLVIWLVCMLKSDPIVIMSVIISLQVLYLFILMIAKPFEDRTNNVIELVNEIIFTILIGLLCRFNTEKAWNGSIDSIFISIMLFNTLIVTVILTISFIYKLKQKFSNQNQKRGSNKIANVSGITPPHFSTMHHPSNYASSLSGTSSIQLGLSKSKPIKPERVVDWNSSFKPSLKDHSPKEESKF